MRVGNDDVPLLDELTYLERLPGVDSFMGNGCGGSSTLQLSRWSSGRGSCLGTFGLPDKVLVLDEAGQWRFSKFLSFGDVATYGAPLGLLTQKHQTNVARVINNQLFRNKADTVSELVVPLEDY